jgi:AcrR family transcriptional regulator
MAAPDFPSQAGDDPEAADTPRERLVAAFGRVASEHGYSQLTVEQVLLYAKVSRATYEAHFETKEQGLIAAQDAFLDRLWLEVVAACDEPVEWPLRVRAALDAVLGSMVEASALARVFAVEAAATSVAAAERQLAALDRFATLLRDGRRHYPQAASLPDATERAVIGGVASILAGHLLMEDPEAIPPQEPELVELLLMPYIGVSEARRVATG